MRHDEALALYNAGPKVVTKILCDLSNTIESLQEQIKVLEIKVAKLSKNSSNSSKPPSSDDITKPKSKKKKKKGKRKIGGQPGHERHNRPLFSEEEVDNLHPYILTSCPDCHSEVSITDGKPRIIQQIELIEVPLIREEHRSYPVWCPKCGKIHYMPFPPEVYKEGLFKERLTALVAYMKNVLHASFSTIRKYIRDVLGEKISRGYLRKVIEKVSLSLEAPYNELLDRLPLETIVNVDETGHKENGDKFWTWVFRAELYVLFKIDKSRGSKVLIDVLGKEFNGVLGCDYFSAYRKYMKDFSVSIQFCIAHLIRDIRFLTTLTDPETKAYFEFITTPGIGPTNNVAEQAIRFVVIDRHVTQGTRSVKGRQSNERLWTVIATCSLQGRSAFNFILESVRAYFHDQPAPSLLFDSS